MTKESSSSYETPVILQPEFERITGLVLAEFQVDEALLDHGVPTYYLKQPQETKQAFLRLLKNLRSTNLIALLKRAEGKIVLRVVPRPPAKPSNILINWILLLATVATTFITGYMLSPDAISPFAGGAAFAAAMLAILGTHEMGHKIAANKKGIAATSPYFVPGPPPFGTFGAVIMQKSLPPNKDALFDVGATGPIAGFMIATAVSIIGLTLSVPSPKVEGTEIGVPILWFLIAMFLGNLNMLPQAPPDEILLLHPVAFAGWVGLLVTMLNLLPAAMLDGGHVARSIFGEKLRFVLTALSILYLVVEGFYPMAFLVLFISMYRHPGPLDDVSGLSTSRKLLAIAMIAIFVLCTIPFLPIL
jgi:membrane-associated protease RseP (regulator of RpoE activity)